MKPKSRTVDGLLHLRYKFPHYIYTSKIYPLSSPNGSNIIICGHERGLLVTWRGGRPFKATPAKKTHREQEDTDDMMAVDASSDEEEEEDEDDDDDDDEDEEKPEFEEEEEEFDPSQPYRPIIQHKELELGTAVLHIAFPRLPQSRKQIKAPLSPLLLGEKIVVALACADSSVRLLTLPLTPPSPGSAGVKMSRERFDEWYDVRANWIDSLIIVPSAKGHRSVPRGISLAFTPRPLKTVEEDDDDDKSGSEDNTGEWDVLIVSHSADLSGKMLIHKVPVSADGLDVLAPSSDEVLLHSERLAGPIASAEIYVSPSSAQSQNPRVLVAEINGPVRIFECTTAESEQGAWSLTLYPGYTSINGQSQPRTVLDAQWVLGGKVAAVLMADGEWGLWDISTPKSIKTISGSIPTKFTLSGWLGGALSKVSPPSKPSGPKTAHSQLVPMTPHTRKVRQEALFSGQPSSPHTSGIGGINVAITSQSLSGKADDETLILWHGDKIALIPSLAAHWRSKFKSAGDPFAAGAGSQLRELGPVDMQGALRCGVGVFPAQEEAGVLRTRHADVLVAAERGFTIIAAPLKEPDKAPVVREGDVLRPLADETLLAKGDLDVGGLDRMLDNMAGGGARNGSPEPSKRRRVGFAS